MASHRTPEKLEDAHYELINSFSNRDNVLKRRYRSSKAKIKT